jgi:hypothetical protein
MWIAQNQTDPKWLNPADPDELGTGLFLVADVQTTEQPLATKREPVKDLTYLACIQRGHLTIAFKWIPHRIASYSTIANKVCNPEPCVLTCVEAGCICDPVSGVCK